MIASCKSFLLSICLIFAHASVFAEDHTTASGYESPSELLEWILMFAITMMVVTILAVLFGFLYLLFRKKGDKERDTDETDEED